MCNYIKYFAPNKTAKPLLGVNFIYGDFLYLYSNGRASILKKKFMGQIINHKNALKKLLHKNRLEFQIQHAFNYQVWNQLYLSIDSFAQFFIKLKNIYKNDKKFQKYAKENAVTFGKKLDKNQVNFFLEEHLMMHLISKGKSVLPNEYVDHREK